MAMYRAATPDDSTKEERYFTGLCQKSKPLAWTRTGIGESGLRPNDFRSLALALAAAASAASCDVLRIF